MIKSEALIQLINSMTQAEKKAFSLNSQRSSLTPTYLSLFNMISKNSGLNTESIKKLFIKEHENKSFDSTSRYLYKLLLDTLLDLRTSQDSYFTLFNLLMKTRILFEKSLFEDCFEYLDIIIKKSTEQENYITLFLALRLELEYMLTMNFAMVNEKALLKKHHKINEVLNIIKKVNGQSSLYELLKYRVISHGPVRSTKQKDSLNDLLLSEMSMIANSNLENFEINKLHQLFQANYLISVGDSKSAFRSYIELNKLFENNKHLWHNPPIYYLSSLEGVLDSLRSMKNYDGMQYFIDQLNSLHTSSVNFNANVNCLVYLYELFPLLDKGDFSTSLLHLEKHSDDIYSRMSLLSLTRQAELSLYTALIYFGNKEYGTSRKYLRMIILKTRGYYFLPLYRTIRLVNLMILYEIGDSELIHYNTRSLRRDLKAFEKGYKTEKFMLSFLNRKRLPVFGPKRDEFWESLSDEVSSIRKDEFEQQVLKIFDFTAWIECKIKRIPLEEILASKFVC